MLQARSMHWQVVGGEQSISQGVCVSRPYGSTAAFGSAPLWEHLVGRDGASWRVSGTPRWCSLPGTLLRVRRTAPWHAKSPRAPESVPLAALRASLPPVGCRAAPCRTCVFPSGRALLVQTEQRLQLLEEAAPLCQQRAAPVPRGMRRRETPPQWMGSGSGTCFSPFLAPHQFQGSSSRVASPESCGLPLGWGHAS